MAAKAINLTLALETMQGEEELEAQTSTNSTAAAAGKRVGWALETHESVRKLP